jgi:hypothetical protein
MSVSSVASPPATAMVPSYNQPAQQADQASTGDADPTYQAPPPAPLPPGQGTRIDQLA